MHFNVRPTRLFIKFIQVCIRTPFSGFMNFKTNFSLNKNSFVLLILLLFPLFIKSQSKSQQDFTLWGWFQVEKKFQKKQYVEFQYQARFNDNVSQFNRSNIYFIYGKNIRKNLNFELLYQLNTNHKNDQHTFYLGFTCKQSLSYRSFVTFRTAVQNTHNYFTGDYQADKPYTEWRNRIRFIYRIKSSLQVAVSAEPYLLFKPTEAPSISRIRFVAQSTYKFNKYESCSLFYLVQPDVISTSPDINYVLGLTFHVTLPNKWNNYKKLIHLREKEDNGENDDHEPFKGSGI